MLNKHPGAQLLKSSGEPPIDIKYGNDQYIQCTAVTPEPDRNLPVFTNPDVPLNVRTYYEHRYGTCFFAFVPRAKFFFEVPSTSFRLQDKFGRQLEMELKRSGLRRRTIQQKKFFLLYSGDLKLSMWKLSKFPLYRMHFKKLKRRRRSCQLFISNTKHSRRRLRTYRRMPWL